MDMIPGMGYHYDNNENRIDNDDNGDNHKNSNDTDNGNGNDNNSNSDDSERWTRRENISREWTYVVFSQYRLARAVMRDKSSTGKLHLKLISYEFCI